MPTFKVLIADLNVQIGQCETVFAASVVFTENHQLNQTKDMLAEMGAHIAMMKAKLHGHTTTLRLRRKELAAGICTDARRAYTDLQCELTDLPDQISHEYAQLKERQDVQRELAMVAMYASGQGKLKDCCKTRLRAVAALKNRQMQVALQEQVPL